MVGDHERRSDEMIFVAPSYFTYNGLYAVIFALYTALYTDSDG